MLPFLIVFYAASPLWAQDDIKNVPTDFTTIQAAVDFYDDLTDDGLTNVPTGTGNLIIEVSAGTYTVTGAITVTSSSWTSVTRRMIIRPVFGNAVTIDGGTNCFNLMSGASFVTISGFTMISTTSNVVNIGPSCNNNAVQGNNIRIDGPFSGITTSGLGTKISHNMIYHAMDGTSGARGIAINSAGNEVYFNSISMRCSDVTNDAIGNLNYALYFNNSAGAPSYIKNNVFLGNQSGLDANDMASVYLFYVFAGTAGTHFISDYNDFYRDVVANGEVYSGYYTGTNRLLLANWQSATGLDSNSLNTYPLFVSTTDLHLQANSPLRCMGTATSGYTSDIDGQSLSSTAPDIGCDEVPPASATPMFGVYDVYGTGPYDSPPVADNNSQDFSGVISAIAEIRKRGISGTTTLNVWSGTYVGEIHIGGIGTTSSSPLIIVERSGDTAVLNPAIGEDYAVRILAGQGYVTVSGFDIAGGTLQSVRVGGSNCRINANRISVPGGGGYGIYLDIDSFNAKVTNNMVYHTAPNATGGRGIHIATGGHEIYYNSFFIKCDSTAPMGSTTNYGMVFNSTGSTCYIKYNIFHGKQSGYSGADNAYVVLFYVASGTPGTNFISDVNDFYRETTLNGDVYTGYYAAVNRQTLADWQSGTGQDGGGWQLDPLFVNAPIGDLHITAASPASVRLGGQSVFAAAKDFDGEVRRTVNLALGADELVDTTAPAVSGLPSDGLGADIDFQTTGSSVQAGWSSVFSDAESGIVGYEWAIGTTPGGTNIQGYTSVGMSTAGTTAISPQSDGTILYVSVRATNGAGLQAVATSDGVMVDTTAPLVGAVNDGTGADIDYQTSTTAVNANWSGFSDAQSGIAEYEWAIGTTPGGTDVQQYTYVGNVASATATGLSLTNGTTYYVSVRATNGVLPVTAVAGGNYHTIVLKYDGTVWTWGNNSGGQLGDGTTVGKTTPIQISGLTGVIAVAGGSAHSIALKNDGTVWTWGENMFGQLGDGTITNRNTPLQVSGLTGVIAIAGGGDHTIVLKSDGTVWSWGRNAYGELGDGTTTDRTTPVQVSGLNGVNAIAGGSVHTIAVKNDRTVWTWGSNSYGQLGDGTNTQRLTPVQVSGLTGVIAIAGGSIHTIALRNDRTVWTWGYNGTGQLGDSSTIDRNTPVQVGAATDWKSIGGGASHTIALKNDGTVWAWGWNNNGQLGDGTTTQRTTPVQVMNVNGIFTFAVGYHHTIAPKNDGTVWSWGRNASGQLGDGSTTDRLTPVRVNGLPGMTVVATSDGVMVDTLPPDTTLSSFPPSVSASSSATFVFASTETGSTFQRNLDGGGWVAVTSPETVTGLGNGSHMYQLRAIDTAGNIDPSPAMYSWIVDTVAPDTTITSGPLPLSSSSTAMFAFIATETASFERNLDGGGWVSVFSPETITGLGTGTHTYQVRAIDPAGNTDPSPAVYSWTIDTTPPAQPPAPNLDAASDTGLSPTDDITSNTAPVFTGSTEPNATVQVYANSVLVGSAMADGSGFYTVGTSLLTEGSYGFTVIAVDAAGNPSPASPPLPVVIDLSPPAFGMVNDGTGIDIDFQTSTTTIDANWSGFIDSLTGIAFYEWAIGTTTGGTDLQGFTSLGSATSATNSSLTLTPGSTCYVTVRAVNVAGLSLTVTSNGVRIAMPQAPMNLSIIAGDGQLSLSWDPALGGVRYNVYYGTSSGTYSGTAALEGASPISVAMNSIVLTGLINNTTYFLAVSATSSAGLEGPQSMEIFNTPRPSNVYTHVRDIAGGTTPDFYRMISFPVLPSNVDPIANLADNLGPYDPTMWRLFAYDSLTGTYVEMNSPGGFQVAPGQAFWIICRNNSTIDVAGSLAGTTQDYAIPLQPGWNLVGHPFNFAVDWAEVRANGVRIGDAGDNGSVSESLWDWVGLYITVDQLVPGRGYWIENVTGSVVTLSIPPVSAAAGPIGPSAKPRAIQEQPRRSAPPHIPPPPPGMMSSPVAGGSGGGGGGGGGCYVASAANPGNASAYLRVILFMGMLLASCFLMGRAGLFKSRISNPKSQPLIPL